MKHLAPIALLALIPALTSCSLVGKVIQTPVRLIQAGVRTVSDADDTTPPATREASDLQGMALKVSERLPEGALVRSN